MAVIQSELLRLFDGGENQSWIKNSPMDAGTQPKTFFLIQQGKPFSIPWSFSIVVCGL